MKRSIIFAAVAAGVATAGAAGPAQAQSLELRFNWWVPGKHLLRTQVAEPWIAAVSKATQGRVKISLSGSSLGAPQRQFDLVRNGIADIAMGAHGYTPQRFILPSAAELPFMGDTAEALSVALWRAYEKYFAAQNEYRGAVVLGLFTHGPGGLWSRNKPIRSLADLSGLKIRNGGGTQDKIVRALGAVGVTSPAPTS